MNSRQGQVLKNLKMLLYLCENTYTYEEFRSLFSVSELLSNYLSDKEEAECLIKFIEDTDVPVSLSTYRNLKQKVEENE